MEKKIFLEDLQISVPVGPGPAAGASTQGYCFLSLINGHALQISQENGGVAVIPTLPEI